MRPLVVALLALLAVVGLPAVALANGTYESNELRASGDEEEIECDVVGTTALNFKVYVNRSMVQQESLGSGQGTFTIQLNEPLEPGQTVVVKGSTSGSGSHSATITFPPPS